MTVQICTDPLSRTFRKPQSSHQLSLAERKFCHHQMFFFLFVCIKSVSRQLDYLRVCVFLSIFLNVRGPHVDEAAFTLHYFWQMVLKETQASNSYALTHSADPTNSWEHSQQEPCFCEITRYFIYCGTCFWCVCVCGLASLQVWVGFFLWVQGQN